MASLRTEEDTKEIARLRRRVARLEKLLHEVMGRNHHWCHSDNRGRNGCACGKTQWDNRIREVLDGKDVG